MRRWRDREQKRRPRVLVQLYGAEELPTVQEAKLLYQCSSHDGGLRPP